MDLLGTPEDSTSVVRIMGELRDFLSGPGHHGHGRPSRSELFGNDTKMKLDFGFSEIKESGRKRQRDTEVQLLSAKSRIASLETDLKGAETNRKRVRIESEQDNFAKVKELQKREDKFDELQKRLRYIAESEEGVKEELGDTKKQFEALKEKYNREVQNYQREQLKLSSKLDEVQEESMKQGSDLRDKLTRQSAELIIHRNRAEEAEAHLRQLKRHSSAATAVLQDYDDNKLKLERCEHRVKELEEKLARGDDAVEIAKAMQSQLSKFKELERQNIKLQEENRLLRESSENALLLQEKLDSTKRKLERAEAKIAQQDALEVENELLKKKLHRWEIEETPDGIKRARSPSELTRIISELQKSQLSMVEKQMELTANVSMKEDSCLRLAEKYDTLKDEFIEVQQKEKKQAEQCSRLQRRLLLVTTERDGIRRILGSYDSDETSSYNPQLLGRVQEAEDRVSSCNFYIEKLEGDVEGSIKELSRYRLMCSKLQAEVDALKTRQAITHPASTVQQNEEASQRKTKVEDLEAEKRELEEKVYILEARIEQRHMQGDFDPTKTKVLHMATNPFAISRKMHADQLDRLREENELLRKKIRLMEEGREFEEGPLLEVLPDGKNVASRKELEEFKSRLESEELKNKRLKEVFSNMVKDFREACYQLCGYRIDVSGISQYKLHSMYAESPDDYFSFQTTPEGELQMLETEFSSQCKPMIDMYLFRGKSIPAFLSNITLDLFGRQTQIVDTSLVNRRH